MTISSVTIPPKGKIPKTYTCRGQSLLPPLHWSHVPADTRSLVLVLSDKTAPASKRYLWAIYNIPRHRHSFSSNDRLWRGEHYAKNSWGHLGYDAPCPPKGEEHRYVFKLYAMKVRFYFHRSVTTKELLQEMKHRVIATATLKAHYGTNHHKH